MVILYLLVLGLAIVIFMIFGARNRKRKGQSETPVVDVTASPHIGRAPGED